MHSLRYLAIALCLIASPFVVAQDATWRTLHDWAKMPDGRTWVSTSTLDVDRAGNVWVLLTLGKPGVARDALDRGNVGEGLAAGGKGAIYAAEVAKKSVTKYVRQ